MTKKILVSVVGAMLLFATLLFSAPAFSTATVDQAKSVTPSGITTDTAKKKTLTAHQKHLLHLRKQRAMAASRSLHRRVYPNLYHAAPARTKAYAKFYIKHRYGWNSNQYACLVPLWEHESGWRYNSDNGDNGRTWGIPQAFPGTKMASAGSDWYDNTATQVRWGAGYIKDRFGNPCNAWNFWRNHKWY